MAAYTCLHRLHAQMLSAVIKSVAFRSVSDRINHRYLHCSFYRKVSKNNTESDFLESAGDALSQTVQSKDSYPRSQIVSDYSATISTDNTNLNISHKSVENGTDKQKKKYSTHTPSIKRKTHSTPSQYFKKSWLKYYNEVSGETEGTSRVNSLQTESLKKLKHGKLDHKNDLENTFGTLSMAANSMGEQTDVRNPNERIDEQMPEDDDTRRDPRLDIPLTRHGRLNKNRIYYMKKIMKLGWQGKIKEAIAVFEDWMMVQDRVMPSKRVFVILIGHLGRVGYTEKAFELYKKMKNLGLDPEGTIYTSLFNSCANSPFPAEGLKQAEYLLNHMKEEKILLNPITANAAMKAFALCGDFSRAFTLLDETSKRERLHIKCFSHLLIACISDKKSGFRRALQVWQKMGQYGIQPNEYSFNLLLRSARDCGVGDLKTLASCFNPDFLDTDKSEHPCLLESITPNKKPNKMKSLSLSSERPVSRAGRLEPNEGKLELIGTKIKIHECPKQEDLNVNCVHNINEQKSVHSLTSVSIREHVNISDSGSMSDGYEIDHAEELSELAKNDSITDLPNNFPDLVPVGMLTHKEQEETPSNKSTLLVSLLPVEQTYAKSSSVHQSIYSDLLTESVIKDSIAEQRKPTRISLKDLKEPSGRLTLLGGARKFISFMEDRGVQPDLKTFTQILACVPNDELSEFELLTQMEDMGIHPDIDFFNDIMTRRFKRKEQHTIEAVLRLVSKLRLVPNMRTYAAIALTCRKEKDAQQLLQDMKEANLEPSSVIMEHLLNTSGVNFTYKMNLLKTMMSMGIKATQSNIGAIERSIAYVKKSIIEEEKRKNVESFYLSEGYQRSFQYFLRYYSVWLQKIELDKPRHPWDSFKKQQENKDEKNYNIIG